MNGASTVLDWQFPNATRFYHGDQSDSFVQNTMWIIDETEPNNCKPAVSDLPGDCWVEAGLKAFNNNGSNATALFWADVRPGYQYADHYGAIVNTLSSTNAIDIQIWKAGTIPNVGWCPIAAAEWCVIIYSEGDGQEMTGISGVNNANRMNVSSYREGMELFGLSGAVANPMYFDFNQWEGTSNNVWHYQDNTGDYAGYKTDPPVDQLWTIYPSTSPSNAGGELMTCITGAGC